MNFRLFGLTCVIVSFGSLAACDRVEAPAAPKGISANPAAIQAAIMSCMSDDTPHLMGLAEAGAVDPDYASNARANAQRCKAAITKLRQMKAPAECIQTAEQIETLQWALSTALAGQRTNASDRGLMTTMDLAASCAEVAHFPKVAPSAEAEAAAKAAQQATEAAQAAAQAATDAMEAATTASRAAR